MTSISPFFTSTTFFTISGVYTLVSETKSDISAYLVADSATVSASPQDKNITPPVDHEHAVYEQEPTLAKRTISVDEFGNFYDVNNPIPVRLSDGSVNIGTVNANTGRRKRIVKG